MSGITRRQFIIDTTVGGFAIVGGAGILGACGSSSSSSAATSGGAAILSGKKIAFDHPFSMVPFVTTLKKYVSQRADQTGAHMLYANDQAMLDAQVTAVDGWITQHVDAICILPLDPNALSQQRKRAQAAGIKFSTYFLPMDGQDGIITFPPEDTGKAIADDVVPWIKSHGNNAKVLILTASTIPPAGGRTKVPEQAITSQTGATVVAKKDALDPATGLQVTEDTLKAHPDLNVVIGFNDDGALGALQAFKNAGKDPAQCYIAGQDGNKPGLQAVLDGGFYKASAALNIKNLGYGVLGLQQRLLSGEKNVRIVIPTTLASLANRAQTQQLLDLLS